MFKVCLQGQEKGCIYGGHTRGMRTYIPSVLCLTFNWSTEMHSSLIILMLRNYHATVKSPTQSSLTSSLQICMKVFPPFGQFANCLVLHVHSHHYSSTGSLVITNNGTEPPGPFTLSNIPGCFTRCKHGVRLIIVKYVSRI